jgi:hypothetical protein
MPISKEIDGEVISAGKIVYEQEMDPDSVVFYVQQMDATLGMGQVLVVVADVFVPKATKKGKIKAKNRKNVATATLGTLSEDFEMVDVSSDTTGDTTAPPVTGKFRMDPSHLF